MSYCRMKKKDLWEKYRRLQAAQTISHIANAKGRDRKTVREYIEKLESVGLHTDKPSVE